MPELTTNLGLEKPLGNETADIAVINSNMDKVDGEITKKASTTEDGRMSKEDKTKLDGVADSANNYQHPAAHAPSVITQDANNRFVTDAEKATWNAKETPSGAQTKINTHANKTDNPHSVTKAQVGLGSVDNVKQATKADFDAHVGDGGKHPTALSQLNGDSTHRTVTDAEKAAWNGKLNAGAKAADSDKLDGIDSSQFVRNDRNNTINGNLAVNGYLQAKGFVSDTTDTVRVMFPSGGAYRTGTSNVTGAIKITLPASWTSTMLRFTVKVFEYTSRESFDVTVGGYNYITGSRWVNTSAYIIGDAGINRDFTVRFGHDGSKCCVYIGETSSTWSYPQVTVTNFEGGFGRVNNETWNDGWDVSFASSFGTISSTITGTQVGRTVDGNIIWHAGNDGSGSGLDADKLDGLHESTFMRKSANSDLDMNNRVIREVGQIQLTDANTRIDEGANNAIRLRTNSGYVDIGPMNSSHCHFYTDRPNFYFDKDLRVRGEIYAGSSYNQKVWHQGNDGAGSGLDADTVDGCHADTDYNGTAYQLARYDVNKRVYDSNRFGSKTLDEMTWDQYIYTKILGG